MNSPISPSTPAISSNSPLCVGQNLQLNTPSVLNATYTWAGPNGFTSNLQNPTIPAVLASDGGLYDLVVSVLGCPSPNACTNVIVYVQL